MRTIQEIITEAKFWKASGLENYNDIRAMVELGEGPMTEMDWDQVLAALDMDEVAAYDLSVAALISKPHSFAWDNYVYDNTVGLEEDEQ